MIITLECLEDDILWGRGGLPRGAEKAESFVAEGGGWGRKEEVAKTETPMLERRGEEEACRKAEENRMGGLGGCWWEC